MLRGIRLVLCGLTFLAATGDLARSQYNYPGGYGANGYGFGGWGGGGSTVEGNYLRGMGAYAQGAGIYNYETAQANSINTDTAIRLNQYLYQSELEARRRYNAHHAGRLNMDKDKYKARMRKLRSDAGEADIDSGDALNALMDQLTSPKVLNGSSATLRLANATIPAASVKEIPFRDETDAITISLDELTESKNWPTPLQAETFKPEREAYQKAVDDALAEDKNGGSLKPETVAKVRDAVARLYDKVGSTIPKTQQPDHLTAMNYLKGLAGLSKMLDRPNVEAVLAELEKFENTTVSNLVAFMHTYSLRFAPATTPKQRKVYREIYPIMLAQRDKILGAAANAGDPAEEGAPPTPIENPTQIFNGFDPNHLHPSKPAPPAPAPKPAPAQP